MINEDIEPNYLSSELEYVYRENKELGISENFLSFVFMPLQASKATTQVFSTLF